MSRNETASVEFETARTVVYPWQCDAMGHLATQHYMKVFDDACYHLLGRLGYNLHESAQTRRGWADVHQSIHYRREIRAGDLVVAYSSVEKCGRTSLSYQTRLASEHRDGDCAVLSGVMVHFDLDLRCAILVPEHIRTAIVSEQLATASVLATSA
jgi:acyl-CoA thioester hydrolase